MKLTDVTDVSTTLALTDLAYTVTDPGGTPGDGATTWQGVLDLFEGQLSAVAVSGSYGDLSGTPTITAFAETLLDDADAAAMRTTLGLGTAATTASTDYATAAQGALADSATQPGDLASVATSGAYSDLSGAPTITAFAETLLDDADAAAARTTLGLATVASTGAYSDLSGTPTLGTMASEAAADYLERADIVGTVSQSGGTPTGAVIEQGDNANGAYVRFADGTQIVWFGTLHDATLLADETATGTATSPATFVTGVARRAFLQTAQQGSEAGAAVAAERLRAGGDMNSTTSLVWAIHSDGVGTGTSRLYAMAVGRWF